MPKVTKMDWCAFNNCTSLTRVNAPQLQEVGPGTFSDCEKLVTLNLLKVKSLEMNVFSNRHQLTTLILHPEVQIYCSQVKTPYSILRCKNLKQVIIYDLDNTPFDKIAFISQLPLHLKQITITLASDIVKNLHYTKKYLKHHVALGDVERQISALYPQLLFSPNTAQQFPKAIQESSKTEELSSPSSIM